MAVTEVRWKYDEDCGTIEIVGHGELFLSGFAYDYEDVVFAGPIEDVGPASIASLRRALIRYMECVPEGQRRPLPPTWEIHVVVGDEEHPEFVDDLEWVFLEPTHLIFRHDGLEVAQDYPTKNNLVADEVERCVVPYLRRHRCKDIEVAVADERDPELGARYCTVSFSPPSRGKTVHDLYRLARGLQEFLVVLDYGGFTMQTLPILLRAGRAYMLIGRWRQTGEVPSFAPDNDPWCKLVAEAKAAGKTMQRVRLVEEPPTDYVKFELACQHHSVDAGEDIRVTVVKPVRDFAVNDDPLSDMFDFWLFDEETVVELEYDRDGRYINAYEVTDTDYRYRAYRSMALKRSIPLKEYSYQP